MLCTWLYGLYQKHLLDVVLWCLVLTMRSEFRSLMPEALIMYNAVHQQGMHRAVLHGM